MPHEEEWKHRGQEEVVRTSEGYIRVAVYAAGTGRGPLWKVARFIAAAPEMARALMDALDALGKAQDALEHAPIPGLADARDAVEVALRTAGVIGLPTGGDRESLG